MTALAESVDAHPGILGLAVPQPPAQALDFVDDHRLRRRTFWVVGRQVAGDPRQVLQPHGEVKPVQDREFRDADVEENAPQPGAAVVSERGILYFLSARHPATIASVAGWPLVFPADTLAPLYVD